MYNALSNVRCAERFIFTVKRELPCALNRLRHIAKRRPERNVMNTHVRNIENPDFVIPSFKDYDLPQVADDDEMVVELVRDIYQRPHAEIAAELHHQIDPSYQ